MIPVLNYTSKATPSKTGDKWRAEVQRAPHTHTHALGLTARLGCYVLRCGIMLSPRKESMWNPPAL